MVGTAYVSAVTAVVLGGSVLGRLEKWKRPWDLRRPVRRRGTCDPTF